MEQEIYQIGIVGVAMIYLIEKGYLLFKGVLAKYNPPDEKVNDSDYSKEMAKSVALISENHLHSIEGCIKEQTKQAHDDHQKQIELLIKIHTTLENKLK